MIEFGIFLCVTTVVFCLYAIIVSRKHRVLTFFLIPLFVVSSLYIYYITNYYRGFPLPESQLPKGEPINLISMKVSNPWIYLLVDTTPEEKDHPRYFVIPWSEQKQQNLEPFQAALKQGNAVIQGEFKQANDGPLEFEMLIDSLPPKTAQ